ncbi:YbfB/YjiJ family MFS transporter [Ramlibacter agri]|uniref:YbfB/YjiJ family MFS transporter n=1 Tax=Ramlibacter agri TaxID=2728837 RepID=UPI00315B3A11
MHAASSFRPLAIALAGLGALAVAMGIGRFAFTPLLPLMMAEGTVTLPGASLLASSNYFGYLLGAGLLTLQPWLWRRLGWSVALNGPTLIRGGLVATALVTAAMALPWPAAWAWWRFAAGLASAVVFLYTSGWCLEQLARRGVPAMGALIYVGPGLGIVTSGLAASALVATHAPAADGWFLFGVLALVLTVVVWRVFDAHRALPAPAATSASGANAKGEEADVVEMGLLAGAYSLAGLGYIVTATFLPVIARLTLPGSRWLDLFWPLFGVGVILGALAASRLRGPGDQRLRLAACYVIQAIGVAASLVSPTLAGFAIGSVLLGLPFTAITFFAMQEARRLRPQHPTSFMGLLTVLWGLGQMVGPPIAAVLVAHASSTAAGFTQSLWCATGALLVGAGLYLLLACVYPVRSGSAHPR